MNRLKATNRSLGNPASDPARLRTAPASLQSSGPATGSAVANRVANPGWHDLVAATADFAFQTDQQGQFVFVAPDPALGWTVQSLLAHPAELLLGDEARHGRHLNPFRAFVPIRAGRTWLRRSDGGTACLSFVAAPTMDDAGRILGAHGFGFDVTDDELRRIAAAARLRRLEVFDDMLWRLRQEVLPSRMIAAALSALAAALDAEGAAIVGLEGGEAEIRHSATPGAAPVPGPDPGLVARAVREPVAASLSGYDVLAAPCLARFRTPEALVAWRACGGAPWSAADCGLVASASGIIRVVLEHEAVQQELAGRLRTDPLTGLLNRHAFADELARRIDRLEREGLPGTLLALDIDKFTELNERAGLEAGDAVLCALAALLCATFRPTDLIGRLGGDEFAVWLDGADYLAAAERAEALRLCGVRDPAGDAGANPPGISFSIGIATRWAGSGEQIEALMSRVDRILWETKQNAPGQWGVSRGEE